MKKTAFLVALAVAVAIAGSAVSAGRGNGGGTCPYGGQGNGSGSGGTCPGACVQVGGVIQSIADQAILLDTGVTVVVSADTVIKMGKTTIALSDLKAGQTITACGELIDSTLTASVVNVKYKGK